MENSKETKQEIFVDIILNFELIHEELIYLIGFILKDVDLSIILFKELSFNIILNSYQKIYKHKIRDDKIKPMFELLDKHLKTSQKYRNKVAHAIEYTDYDKDNKTINYIYDKKEYKEITIEKLKEYQTYLNNTFRLLIGLLTSYKGWIPHVFEKDVNKWIDEN